MKIRDSRANLIVRGFYGLIYMATVVGAILFGPYGFGLFLLAIIVGGTFEFDRIIRLSGYRPQLVLAMVSSVLLFALNYDHIFLDGTMLQALEVLFILTIPAMFVAELFSGSKTPIADVGATLLSLIYVAIPTMLLCNVAMLLGAGEWNGVLMVAYIAIIWANDTFAYIIGITLGRKIMFARISPKKTWEGFFGGVIGALVVGILFAHFMEQNCFVWGGMAVISSITGVIGDLVESMFKRSVQIKDSGNIIPGHGGWLDRFDAILISTPVVFAYLYLLDVIDII